MTLHTTALSLFASTIASGLGLALTSQALFGDGNSLALLAGLAMLLLGPAAFVGIASRAVRGDEAMLKVVIASFAAGFLSVWFWLVPAQKAVMTVACHVGNLGACEAVVTDGGFAADVALSNDDFVVQQCEVFKKANYCRIAAARRLSHPARFCPNLDPAQGFEVVEWCTPNRQGDLLVARR